MGYQEYVYKVAEPKEFIKNKKEIDKFITNDLLEQVDYEFVEFKKELVNIKPGYYLWIYGDRWYGQGLIGHMIENYGMPNYCQRIENAIESCGNYTPADIELKNLAKYKSTSYGRVICKYEVDKQYEKNQREF